MAEASANAILYFMLLLEHDQRLDYDRALFLAEQGQRSMSTRHHR